MPSTLFDTWAKRAVPCRCLPQENWPVLCCFLLPALSEGRVQHPAKSIEGSERDDGHGCFPPEFPVLMPFLSATSLPVINSWWFAGTSISTSNSTKQDLHGAVDDMIRNLDDMVIPEIGSCERKLRKYPCLFTVKTFRDQRAQNLGKRSWKGQTDLPPLPWASLFSALAARKRP
jgi:hypothetical protein